MTHARASGPRLLWCAAVTMLCLGCSSEAPLTVYGDSSALGATVLVDGRPIGVVRQTTTEETRREKLPPEWEEALKDSAGFRDTRLETTQPTGEKRVAIVAPSGEKLGCKVTMGANSTIVVSFSRHQIETYRNSD